MSSKLDGICEVLKHKNNSIIVNKYDPKSWIKYMEDIIKNIIHSKLENIH